MKSKINIASIAALMTLTSSLSAHEVGVIHAHNDISLIAIGAAVILFTGVGFYISKLFSK
jgi:hypothetical protein